MAYKLLVVDDERDIVEVLQDKLTREGFEVVTASDGKMALVRLENDNPDIVLLDLVMPEMNGFEVLREVRTKYREKWRPVIIISSKNEFESVAGCYDLEADLYLTKPCSFYDILAGIKKMTDILSIRENNK
ncbi:MAG: response regulator [Candidatus Omnitrophica bacterium]|nr:response regulator [Candidatus Omnitrophota bacterium]